MRKLKKEFILNNNSNIYYLREKKLIFFKLILLTFKKINLRRNAYKKIYFFTVIQKSMLCIFSGRRNNINKKFHLSRIALRSLIYKGGLIGYKKSSW